MKRVNVKIIDLYSNTKFEDLNKEFNDVYSVMSSLNDCIIDISLDMKNSEAPYTCASKIIDVLKNILNKYDERFLSKSDMINEFLNNERNKDVNIFNCMIGCLDEYRKPIDTAISALRSSIYRYSTEANYIVNSSNTIFALKEQLRKNKDGSLMNVLKIIYDIYNEIIICNMLDNSYFANEIVDILYKFIVGLRNILSKYANGLDVIVYIDD